MLSSDLFLQLQEHGEPVELQENIEWLIEHRPPSQKRRMFSSWKNQLRTLMHRYNSLVDFKAYNTNRIP